MSVFFRPFTDILEYITVLFLYVDFIGMNITNVAESIKEKMASYCKEQGLVCTSTRLQVAVKLAEINRYIDAVTLFLLLKREKKTISISSVYLCLNFMVEAGFADMDKRDRTLRFRISYKCPTGGC